MILTLSIGSTSVNSPLSPTNAQKSALYQNGNGESEQETEQGQSSSQANQVVSGDSSFASGNNLLCKTMDNLIPALGGSDQCEVNESNTPPSQGNIWRVELRVASTVGVGCTDCFENFANITLDAGQRYVEHLTFPKGVLSKHYDFSYNIPTTVTEGKLMIDINPVLGSQKLVQLVIEWGTRAITVNCSPYSVNNPHTTCTLGNIKPLEPLDHVVFAITARYYNYDTE